jgi:hypothetical protein
VGTLEQAVRLCSDEMLLANLRYLRGIVRQHRRANARRFVQLLKREWYRRGLGSTRRARPGV